MDIRYANALRNATNAWAQNRVTDTVTLQDLKRRAPNELEETQVVLAPDVTQSAHIQPQLAQFGHLGTKLNIYA